MPKVGAATHARGISQKQVVVESIDRVSNEAVVKDGTGMRHRISLKVQRVGIEPSRNEVWMIDKAWGGWVFTGRLSGGPIGHQHGTRQKTSYTTGLLAAGATEAGLIDLSPHYVILFIETTVPSRTRLYNTLADQTKDLTRSVTTQPEPGLGIVMDYLTADVLLSAPLTPVPHGASFAEPPVARHPISVTSVNGGPVTVTLTWVSEE